MTHEERMFAVEMRLRGYTWAQIGAALHYDARSVEQDISRALRKPRYAPPILYPCILSYVQRVHRGSINAFAAHCT